jgi:hypothetical protein
MSKFNEIIKERKYKNWCKPMSFLLEANPPLKNKYPIIDNSPPL